MADKPTDDADPKDCPYHRIISHTIKDWLQKQINEGNLVLPDEPKQVNVVSTIPQPSKSDSATNLIKTEQL